MSKAHPSIEESTTLCLACSSSMPPSVIRRYRQGLLENDDDKAYEKPIFFTNCCRRPICPSCVAANARLMRYDPCLHCLGGVDVVANGMASTSKLPMAMDQDLFVLGDDEEDTGASPQVGPPPYEEVAQDREQAGEVVNTEEHGDSSIELNQGGSLVKYYLAPSDTLQGIALRLGVNGYDLCQLNNLPPSTLTTMPKLLHTRTYILLPSASKARIPLSPDSGADAKKEINRERGRAEKKLQMVMKEVDWRVAKAYVALAEDFYTSDELRKRFKETGEPSTLSGVAIDMYTEDSRWENTQKCLRR